MDKPVHEVILESSGARESLLNNHNCKTGRGFRKFYRFCKKCGEVFKTTQQRAKVCYFCNGSRNVDCDAYLFDEVQDLTKI